MEILQLKGITHDYDGTKVLDVPALSIEKGGIYGVVGPNGSGKTTLLAVMGLILRPTTGEVYFHGHPVRYESETLAQVRRSITMTLQNPYLFDTSVAANVAYGLRAKGTPRKSRDAKVREALELVGMSGFEKRRGRELSGGETQLVALARALVLEPDVLLLDEPTANLDAPHVRQIERVVLRSNKEWGTTVVATIHNLSQIYRWTTEVFSLFDGRLVPSTMFNLFAGKIVRKGEGPCFEAGPIRIWVPPDTPPADTAHITINPEDIIVSPEPFTSSARNQFQGTVTEIVAQGGDVLLKVHSQEVFSVRITEPSLREMRLSVGSQVFLTFKAMSVQVL